MAACWCPGRGVLRLLGPAGSWLRVTRRAHPTHPWPFPELLGLSTSLWESPSHAPPLPPKRSNPAKAATDVGCPPPPCGWAMASAVEKPDTKVPGVRGVGRRALHATQPSGSFCTLRSSTCVMFENGPVTLAR